MMLRCGLPPQYLAMLGAFMGLNGADVPLALAGRLMSVHGRRGPSRTQAPARPRVARLGADLSWLEQRMSLRAEMRRQRQQLVEARLRR